MPDNKWDDKKKDNPVTSTVKEGGKTVDATVDTVGKSASNAFTETGKTIGSAERAATNVGTGAIHGVDKVGGEAGGLVKGAAMGTLDAADDVGSKAGGMAKKAATNTRTPARHHQVGEDRRTREVATRGLAEAPQSGLRRAQAPLE